jgi:hypothetical protein
MSMNSRKNALAGWLMLVVGKQLILTKLRKPPEPPKSHKVRNGLVAATAASVVGVATYLRFRPNGGGHDPVVD